MSDGPESANELGEAEVHDEEHEDDHGWEERHVCHPAPVVIIQAERQHLKAFLTRVGGKGHTPTHPLDLLRVAIRLPVGLNLAKKKKV